MKILALEPMIGFAVSQRLKECNDIQEPAPPTIYRDPVQEGFIGSQLAVRTSIAPDAVAGVVRETESAVLKTVPIERIMTLNEQIDASIVPERLVPTLSGWCGALLAAIELYGLLAYMVTRRTHEIGVRMALGATRSDVMRIVLHDALWTVCAALALGAPLVFWTKSVAASLMRGLPANRSVSSPHISRRAGGRRSIPWSFCGTSREGSEYATGALDLHDSTAGAVVVSLGGGGSGIG